MCIVKAIDLLDHGCQGNKGASCYELAILYRNGGGVVAKDAAKAKEFMEKACSLGEKRACPKR